MGIHSSKGLRFRGRNVWDYMGIILPYSLLRTSKLRGSWVQTSDVYIYIVISSTIIGILFYCY